MNRLEFTAFEIDVFDAAEYAAVEYAAVMDPFASGYFSSPCTLSNSGGGGDLASFLQPKTSSPFYQANILADGVYSTLVLWLFNIFNASFYLNNINLVNSYFIRGGCYVWCIR